MDNFLFIALIILLVVIPLMSTRKRYQRIRSIEQYQAELAPGRTVQMTCGIQGVIVSLTEQTVDLQISPGVITTWDRKAVLQEAPDYSIPQRADFKESLSSEDMSTEGINNQEGEK